VPSEREKLVNNERLIREIIGQQSNLRIGVDLNLEEVRRVAITALFADDVLMNKFVLKGGNALHLVYGLSGRTSLDLDLSLDTDFDDFEDAKRRLRRSLEDRFDAVGIVVFDFKLEPRPKIQESSEGKIFWGGYQLDFKLIEKEKRDTLGGELRAMQRSALVVGQDQQKIFTVDFSKFEHTEGKRLKEFEKFEIYVYSLEMIVCEKLRALCQQMHEYAHGRTRKARARDLYDIYCVVHPGHVKLDSPEAVSLLKDIFQIKEVSLSLLGLLPQYREYHRQDWPAVIQSVGEEIENYDFYFEFVLSEVEKLKPFWNN